MKLDKVKYPNDKTADFFDKSRNIINTALKMNYKDSNTSTFIDAEEDFIIYLAGCSAVINDRTQVIVRDVITAYETYYKLLKTDVTQFRQKTDLRGEPIGGYLVCNRCGEYYKLQPNESPDDFTDICKCGGKLSHYTTINWLLEKNNEHSLWIKLKIAPKTDYFIKALMVIAFIFISGFYLAYSFSPSTEFLIKIVLTTLIGVTLGSIAAFKLDKQKTEYLIVFAFLIALISSVIFTLAIGHSLRGIDLSSLTPDKYALVLQGIMVVTGIMGLVSGCLLCVAFKNFTKNEADEIKTKIYLVCDKCGEYCQLKPDKSVDDFSDPCKCGGHLECKMVSEKLK